MKRQSKQFTYAITTILIALFVIFSLITGGGAQLASAAASPYSDALEDLRTDGNFTVDEYPVIERDYSLNVIQIAESTDGELLIYVYQPAADKALQASSINIAKQDNATAKFNNYPLIFLNSNGVFYKYKVDGFELSNSTVRYYNISNILRSYDKVIDEPPAAGQIISEVPNAVGQLWTVYPDTNSVTYEPSTIITVTEKCVGFVNYDEGVNVGWAVTSGATSAHFVAFSTDKPIDQLISADVSFNEQEVNYQYCCNVLHPSHTYQGKFNYKYGDKVKHEPDPVTLTYKDNVTIEGKDVYTLNRIRSTAEFLADENNSDYKLTSEGSTGIERTQWVLNFYETPIEMKLDNVWVGLINGFAALFTGDADCRYTQVSDVMILRLKYKYDGEYYNLGVVDNKQTGSNRPVNEPVGSGCTASWEWLNALPIWAWCIIFPAGVVVAVLLVLLIAWLVTLPFKKLSERRAQARHARNRPSTKNRRNSR